MVIGKDPAIGEDSELEIEWVLEWDHHFLKLVIED